MSETNQTNQEQNDPKTLTPEQEQVLKHGRQMEGMNETFVDPKDESAGKEKQKQEEKQPEKAEEKPDPVEGEGEQTDPNAWKDDYVQIDNPYAQSAINLLKEAKVSPVEANDIFKDAIEANDLSKVDWARLEKKVGADKALLIKQGVETYYNEQYKVQYETVQKGYDTFGGEEGWKKAKTYFDKLAKSDQEFSSKRDQFRKMLDMGGWAAERALSELKEIYTKDPKNSGIRARTDNLERGGTVATQSNALTKDQYRAELAKIDTYTPEGQRAYQELRARRAAGMQAGI